MPLEHNAGTVMVTTAQFAEMKANQAKVEEMLAAREIEATAANIRATAASGQVEQLARSHRQEIEQERQRAASIAAKAELATALAKQPLLPHAIEQLSSLLAPEITATDNGRGGFNILSRDYKDVSTFVADTLASTSYSHFRADAKPQPPVNRPTPTAPQFPEPKNAGESIIAAAQARREAEAAARAGTSAATDMSQGFGIPSGKPAWSNMGFGLRR
jgi:hypothetical protein